MSDDQRESDFERESSRLNEGLKTCRTVVDNYRAMIAGDHRADNDDGDMTNYVSTTGESSKTYENDSATN